MRQTRNENSTLQQTNVAIPTPHNVIPEDRFSKRLVKLRRILVHIKEKIAERNSVQRWLSRKMIRLTQKLGFSICGDHFYEPIPNLALIRKKYIEQRRKIAAFCPDPVWVHEANQLLSQYLSEYISSQAYLGYGNNWYYRGWDAAYYYCLVRSIKPSKITEVGRGFSTRIAGIALEQNLREGDPGEITSIDPYFRGECGSTCSTRIVRKEVQQIDAEDRRSLLSADILFIDSSHVLKWGSDVLHLFESWIPEVRVGALVHIHDIFTPFDYPKEWMIQAKRFWNEQYILESFLAFNNCFRIRCPLYYLSSIGAFRATAECVGSAKLMAASGSAMWLERTR